MEPKNDLRQGLPVAKAAETLGVCEQTIRNLYRQRELEGYQVGRKVLIFADSLASYQTKHSNLGGASEPTRTSDCGPVQPVFVPLTPPRRRRRGVPDYDRHRR